MKKNNKGFTLMEMLIVVAIIGVLAAILIPTVSSNLTKSKQAADQANVRAIYAEAVSESLLNGGSATKTFGPTQAACEAGTKIGDLTAVSGTAGDKQFTCWTSGATVTVTATTDAVTITSTGGTTTNSTSN